MYRICKTLLVIGSILIIFGASPAPQTSNPHALLLNTVQKYNVILLGTTHRSPPILDFITEMLPKLSSAGVTHIGLEIASDQQPKIDSFIRKETKTEAIEISPIIDCPAYRHLLEVIRDYNLHPIALDLPRSMWNTAYTRDQWMAHQISRLFTQDASSKLVVIVGNLHVVKKVEWIDRENKEKFIRGYLSQYQPALQVLSVAECFGDGVSQGDLLYYLGTQQRPIAVQTTHLNFPLTVLDMLAAKPVHASEEFDAVIIF